MYYVFIKDEKIISKSQCKCLNDDILNIEVEEEVYNNIEKYMYQDGEIILDPDYEEKQAQEERERIAQLYLTGADVERGIYQAKGMDFDDILAFVTANPPEGIDIKALKIELKANHFYRGNPYVSAIGALLGFTEEQLDLFFEDGNYEHLLPKEEPTEVVEEETEVEDEIS